MKPKNGEYDHRILSFFFGFRVLTDKAKKAIPVNMKIMMKTKKLGFFGIATLPNPVLVME